MTNAALLRSDLLATFGEFGRSLTVRRMAPDVYDPSTGGTVPVSGEAPYTDYAGIGRLGTYADDVIDGTMITDKDRKATFVPTSASFVPEINDRLIAGSDVYTVVRFQTREINDDLIVYTLQVRR